jgi:hypothetical protein
MPPWPSSPRKPNPNATRTNSAVSAPCSGSKAQQADRVPDFNAILLEKGSAACTSFALPPDPVTAELLQRDQHVFRWTAAYRAENERANAAECRLHTERAEFGRQLADYKLKLAQRDAAVARRTDNAPAVALTLVSDRCTDLQRKLDECDADLTTARASAKFHKKQHHGATLYYQHKLALSSQATINALSAEMHHRDRADAAYATIERLEKALADVQITQPRPPDVATSPAPPTHVPTSPASPGATFHDDSSDYGWSGGIDYDARATPPSPSASPPPPAPPIRLKLFLSQLLRQPLCLPDMKPPQRATGSPLCTPPSRIY